MRVLVMMEYSGRVRDAFLRRGHYAVSCDLLPSESDAGEHSTLHWYDFLLQYPDWDLMIAHPPCTFLASSGARWFDSPKYPTRRADQQEAIKVVEGLWNQPIPKIAIENPIGVLPRLSAMGAATQIVQPWWFGDPETKATCLWEKNLPLLQPTNICCVTNHSVHHASPGPDRWKDRSRTFQGFADAMADQWG